MRVALVIAVLFLIGCSSTEPPKPKEPWNSPTAWKERITEYKVIRAKEPLHVIAIHKYCACGGEFKPTGLCLTSYPPQYPHSCSKCGTEKTWGTVYPNVVYTKTITKKETE